MKCSIVDIHTHRPTGKALEPSFAGIHPWQAETRRIEEIVPRFGEVDLVGEIGLDYARHGRPGGPAPDFPRTARLGRTARQTGRAALREGLRSGHARTGSPCTAGGDLPRLHRIVPAGGRSHKEGLLPLLRGADVPLTPHGRSPAAHAGRKPPSPKRTKATCRSRRFTAGSPKRKTSTLNC